MSKALKGNKVEIDKSGKLISVTTQEGHKVTNIVKDSMEFRQDLLEKASGLVKLKLELFVFEDNITISEVQDKEIIKNNFTETRCSDDIF